MSQRKKNDMEDRYVLLQLMASALRLGFIDIAKELGKNSEELKQRITTHDYVVDDLARQRVDNLLLKLSKTP